MLAIDLDPRIRLTEDPEGREATELEDMLHALWNAK